MMQSHSTQPAPRRALSGIPASTRRRAAIYCRVSSRAQAEDDKVSLDDQLAECEAYCDAHEYDVVFRGRDIMSGTTYRRPDFLRLLRLIKDGEIDIVVAWKVDRLGRGMFPMSRLLEVCDPTGTEIEAVRERVDRKHLGLLASVAKIELDNIRERTTAARLTYARQGKVPNGITAYGYRVDAESGKPVRDETETAVLLEAAERYATGELPNAIIRDFRARRVPTRLPNKIKHQPWTKTYLLRLLSDEAYVTGRRTYGTGEQVVAIEYPTIYPPELWERLVTRRGVNRRTVRRQTVEPYLLRGLLHCTKCRGACYPSTRRTGRRRIPTSQGGGWRNAPLAVPRLSYRCAGMEDYDQTCRVPRYIDARALDDRVWRTLFDELRRPEVILEGVREKLVRLEAERPDDTDEPQKALERLAAERLTNARERIRGKIAEADLDTLLAENETETAYWQERADAAALLDADAARQRAVLEQAAAVLDGHVTRLGGDPDGVPFADRRVVVLALVKRVVIDGQGHPVIEGFLESGDTAGESAGGAERADDGDRAHQSSRRSSTPSPFVRTPHTWRVPFVLAVAAAPAG